MSARPAPRILVLDDDAPFRRLIAKVLEREGYPIALAADGREARAALAAQSFALVVCDLELPGESGSALIDHISAGYPGTAVLVVSGGSDRARADHLLARGAYGYLIKPFSIDQFLITVSNALRRRELERERLLYELTLEHAVAARTAELQRSREETVRCLAAAVDSRDGVTGLHSGRTAQYTRAIARTLGWSDDACDLLALAAPLHDIGKISIPDRILHKPGPLTARERATMETHAAAGYFMLAGSGEELLELAATIAWTHHERLDGSGYPCGLRGEEIPAAGRMTAVADVLDALTSDRPYRRAYPLDDALEKLESLSGRALDSEMVDALVESLDDDLGEALRPRFLLSGTGVR
jgi:putative two-component system response regulator